MSLTTEREKIAHLLRRAGLGASASEVDYYSKMGLNGAVDALLEFDKVESNFTIDPYKLSNDKGVLPPQIISGWWTLRMMVTNRPLEEKMTLFWHDHFGVSAEQVPAGPLMLQHVELLRKLAISDFRTILMEVSKNPAMMEFLNTNTNVKGKPNENFAREIMELFSVGIGNYTEQDIQEAARAFTGWTFSRPGRLAVKDGEPLPKPEFLRRVRLHDDGPKTVLGKTGNFDGDDIVDILVAHPATARNICTKLWTWFAYEKPEKPVVDAMVQTWNENNGSIKAVLKRMFTSQSFYSDKAERKLYKTPVDFVIGLCRSLGLGQAQIPTDEAGGRRVLGAVIPVSQAISRMGMKVLFPPSVAGWDWGSAWVNSATMLERIKFADVLYGGTAAAVGNKKGEVKPNQQRLTRGRVPGVQLFGTGELTSAEEIVTRVLNVYDATFPMDKRQVLVDTVHRNGGPDALRRAESSQFLAHELSKLVFASPEFQFS